MAASPNDPRLAEKLRALTADPNRTVREKAIPALGKLHHASDLPLFQRLSEDPDPTVASYGRDAIEEIEAFTGSSAKAGGGR
jgi:HEAT repeat protein